MTINDWGFYLLAGFVGACVGWMACALWTARWIARERQMVHEQVDPVMADMVREVERLRLQERFNRERA